MKTIYENIGGTHTTREGVDVLRGQTFEDPDPDLCAKFPNKLRKVTAQQTPVNAPAGGGVAPTPPQGAESPDKGGEISEKRGTDVTGEFTVDKAGTLSVLKDGTGWHVYEKGDPDPLNEKPLKKKEVQAFIDDYISEGAAGE